LAGLNVNTIIIGMVGDDDSGKKMICMLKDLGANTDYLVIKNNDQTTQKTRLVASNQQLVRFDWDNETITDGEKFLLIKNIKSIINKVDIVIISDYNKGVCFEELVQTSISCCNDRKKLIIIDPKDKSYSKYTGATLIKPNSIEAQEIVPFDLNDDESFKRATNWIIDSFKIKTCIITRGKNGMVLNNKRKIISISSLARDVFDVSGAGDTVIATLAVFLCCGFSYEESAHIANKAAGIVVSHPGTYPINMKTLMSRINQ